MDVYVGSVNGGNSLDSDLEKRLDEPGEDAEYFDLEFAAEFSNNEPLDDDEEIAAFFSDDEQPNDNIGEWQYIETMVMVLQ
ncbi:hypothetical protein CVT25_006193 [Psilocybe cyanescens]|uniref:Uncharacterized protein n=1 Tax=Psilocybe cyanescens TaxID=93625 RepID=A0A409XVU3_PSICY|nr:hypothetical protein CVT25_006193 [Psilocybe cyanescens]